MSLQQLLLNKMKSQNPQAYERLMGIYRSGKDPNEAIREMYQRGEISDSQLKQVQRQAALFGVSIPDSEIKKAEAVEQHTAPSRFKGLF